MLVLGLSRLPQGYEFERWRRLETKSQSCSEATVECQRMRGTAQCHDGHDH